MDAMQVAQAANEFMAVAATFPGDTMPHIMPVRLLESPVALEIWDAFHAGSQFGSAAAPDPPSTPCRPLTALSSSPRFVPGPFRASITPQAGTASVFDPEGAKAAFQPSPDENARPTTPPEIAKCVPLADSFQSLEDRVLPVRSARHRPRPLLKPLSKTSSQKKKKKNVHEN